MKNYETILIIDPDISDEERDSLLNKVKSIISPSNNIPINVEPWGRRVLAYEIKKKSHGYYFQLNFCVEGKVIKELETFLKINDKVIKYLTVVTIENAIAEDIEKTDDKVDNKVDDKDKSDVVKPEVESLTEA